MNTVNVETVFKKDSRANLLKGIWWALLMILMIVCVTIDFAIGLWPAAILALFATGLDGYNAFTYLRNWWRCYQTYKLLSNQTERTSNPE